MSVLDIGLILLYLAIVLSIAFRVGRGQRTDRDYYLADGRLPWWASGMSVMATQTSAISFISIPAFVALKPGGGLRFIQYEFALPLAMTAAMVLIFPTLQRSRVVSIYEFLEQRFDRDVRLLLSGVFLLSRGLATGVMVYATGIVLSVIIDLPFWATLLIIGGGAVASDMVGGIKAVVYTDVIQLVVLVAGLLVAIIFGLDMVGGWTVVQETVSPERWITLTPATGFTDGSATPLWGFLIGGFFLYVAYYATDQSQAQRVLAAGTGERMRRALLLNGLARFPLTLMYLILGLVLAALVATTPELAEQIPPDRLDTLVPAFVAAYLPEGVRALLIAALLSAAMSSLDSALNALSAATSRDFLETPSRPLSIRANRLVTLAWGIAVTAIAFIAGGIADTVVEAINKIGSAFYGPVLAAFSAGILLPRVTATGIKFGVAAGVALNLALWLCLPGLNWMWWNAAGLLVAIAVAVLTSMAATPARVSATASAELRQQWRYARTTAFLLFAWFVLILVTSAAIPLWLGPG
jgi:SSS family transporter